MASDEVLPSWRHYQTTLACAIPVASDNQVTGKRPVENTTRTANVPAPVKPSASGPTSANPIVPSNTVRVDPASATPVAPTKAPTTTAAIKRHSARNGESWLCRLNPYTTAVLLLSGLVDASKISERTWENTQFRLDARWPARHGKDLGFNLDKWTSILMDLPPYTYFVLRSNTGTQTLNLPSEFSQSCPAPLVEQIGNATSLLGAANNTFIYPSIQISKCEA